MTHSLDPNSIGRRMKVSTAFFCSFEHIWALYLQDSFALLTNFYDSFVTLQALKVTKHCITIPEAKVVSAKKTHSKAKKTHAAPPNDRTHDAPEADATLEADTQTQETPTSGDGATAAETAPGAVTETTTKEAAEDNVSARLEQAEARAAEYLDSLQRERAAFQNYKRRTERERADQAKVAEARLLLKLLPVLDDFYRAMDAVPQDRRDEWFEGVALILRKLERYLQDAGVTEIEAVGQPFDPNYHEVVGMDGESEAESGTVTDVLRRGYMQGERVLRPALVRVAE